MRFHLKIHFGLQFNFEQCFNQWCFFSFSLSTKTTFFLSITAVLQQPTPHAITTITVSTSDGHSGNWCLSYSNTISFARNHFSASVRNAIGFMLPLFWKLNVILFRAFWKLDIANIPVSSIVCLFCFSINRHWKLWIAEEKCLNPELLLFLS